MDTSAQDSPTASPLMRLLRQGGMYTLSNLVVKVAGLLLLRFFFNPSLLSQADYGRFHLREVTARLLILNGGCDLQRATKTAEFFSLKIRGVLPGHA